MRDPQNAAYSARMATRRWPFNIVTPPRPREPLRTPAPPRWIGPLLALAFFVLYALTSAGTLTSKDGGVMYDTAMAIVNRHTLALPPHHHGLPGVHGGFYSKYGLAQSLAEIPLFAAGQALASRLHDALAGVTALAVTMLTNPLIMALAVWLFFLLAYELAPSARGAAVAAALLGLASPYWPYAKTDFSEPLSALCLTGAVLFLLRARSRPAAHTFALVGGFVALALQTKLTAAFAVPALGLYALYVATTTRDGRWGAAVGRMAAWLLPIGAGLGLTAWYNVARYGHMTDTGYHAEDLPFHAPLLPGLEGLLVSFGKGLLWYCPLVLAALALWPLLLRRRRAEGLLALGIILPTLVVYATYPVWWGGICWGPRYLLPVLPFILLPLAFAVETCLRRALLWRVLLAVAAFSALVQVAGVAIHPNRFLATGIADVMYLQKPLDSPLLGQAWLAAYDGVRLVDGADAGAMLAQYPWRHTAKGPSLAQRLAINNWDYWWWQILGAHGLRRRDQVVVAVACAVLLLAVVLALRRRLRRLEESPYDHGRMAVPV